MWSNTIFNLKQKNVFVFTSLSTGYFNIYFIFVSQMCIIFVSVSCDDNPYISILVIISATEISLDNTHSTVLMTTVGCSENKWKCHTVWMTKKANGITRSHINMRGSRVSKSETKLVYQWTDSVSEYHLILNIHVTSNTVTALFSLLFYAKKCIKFVCMHKISSSSLQRNKISLVKNISGT